MTPFMSLMALGLTVVSCLIYSGPSLAAEQPNLIIMGEDADPDAVPRDSRIFGRVLDALSNELSDEGFDVYDETAVTLDDFVQGRIFRTDDEIIDIARSINRPPIDVAVIFTIFASRNSVGYTTKITSRIEGRLLNVRSGQRLGNFEVDFPATRNAPPDCNRDCLLRHVGNLSHTLAHDLGAVLSEKLAHLVDRDHDHDHGEGEDEDDRRDRPTNTAATVISTAVCRLPIRWCSTGSTVMTLTRSRNSSSRSAGTSITGRSAPPPVTANIGTKRSPAAPG